MPILDELANHVREFMIPGMQADHIQGVSQTAAFLDKFARYKSGPAGDDIGITHLTDQANTRWYRGTDSATRELTEGTVSHRAQWSNLQADMVLNGTDLESVLGIKSSLLVERRDNLTLSAMSEPRLEALFNIVETRLKQAAVSAMSSRDRSLWEVTIAGDNVSRMPEGILSVFNETGSLHGLGVTGLGDFPLGHPWRTNPPNTANDTDLHRIQRFDNSGGGAQTITQDLLDGPAAEMSALVPGFWLCPLHPTLFNTLHNDGDFDSALEIPMGVGRISVNVFVIRIGNSLYFSEAYAPTDTAYHIHVGTPGNDDGSFFPVYWESGDDLDTNAVLQMVMSTPNNADISDLSANASPVIPWYTQEMTRHTDAADAVSSEVQLKYSYVCTYRWKHYEVADLQA